MSKELIIQRFCVDYGVKEGSTEFKDLSAFADEIKSTEILRRVLDSANHPSTKIGSKPRPNMATLRVLLGKFIQERADEKRQETMSVVSPEEDCWYCTAGYVLAIQERRGLWSTYTAGRCECNQGNDTGHMARIKPIRPTQEIQDYARDHSMDCPWAADSMVYERNQAYRDERANTLELPLGEGTSKEIEIEQATGFGTDTAEHVDTPKKPENPPNYDFGDGFEREDPTIPF